MLASSVVDRGQVGRLVARPGRGRPRSAQKSSERVHELLQPQRPLRWATVSRARSSADTWSAGLARSSSTGPSMSVSGVRNSWLTLLKNVGLGAVQLGQRLRRGGVLPHTRARCRSPPRRARPRGRRSRDSPRPAGGTGSHRRPARPRSASPTRSAARARARQGSPARDRRIPRSHLGGPSSRAAASDFDIGNHDLMPKGEVVSLDPADADELRAEPRAIEQVQQREGNIGGIHRQRGHRLPADLRRRSSRPPSSRRSSLRVRRRRSPRTRAGLLADDAEDAADAAVLDADRIVRDVEVRLFEESLAVEKEGVVLRPERLPVLTTPSKSGPRTCHTSLQHSRAGRPSAQGCFAPNTGA